MFQATLKMFSWIVYSLFGTPPRRAFLLPHLLSLLALCFLLAFPLAALLLRVYSHSAAETLPAATPQHPFLTLCLPPTHTADSGQCCEALCSALFRIYLYVVVNVVVDCASVCQLHSQQDEAQAVPARLLAVPVPSPCSPASLPARLALCSVKVETSASCWWENARLVWHFHYRCGICAFLCTSALHSDSAYFYTRFLLCTSFLELSCRLTATVEIRLQNY